MNFRVYAKNLEGTVNLILNRLHWINLYFCSKERGGVGTWRQMNLSPPTPQQPDNHHFTLGTYGWVGAFVCVCVRAHICASIYIYIWAQRIHRCISVVVSVYACECIFVHDNVYDNVHIYSCRKMLCVCNCTLIWLSCVWICAIMRMCVCLCSHMHVCPCLLTTLSKLRLFLSSREFRGKTE